MRTTNKGYVVTVLGFLLVCATFAQDDKETAQRGFIDAGVRNFWGDEFGRPDLPFRPDVKTSKFNEYRDVRDGFFIRRFRFDFQNMLSDHWLTVQSQRAIYRDQSYLATFGRYNRYQVRFRYDEIPHLYTNTSRTIFAETAPGVFTIPVLTRNNLQALSASTALPSTIQTQIVPSLTFITPNILRRAGSLFASYDLTDSLSIFGSFWREHESGTRPFGLVLNSSPSAALTGGYGVEVPEPINYFSNLVRAGADYGKQTWGVQLSYTGSFFENNLTQIQFDNPFRTSDCLAPSASCNNATQGPAVGRASLYPDNSANYVTVAGAAELGKKVHLLASISPGWLRQNAAFLPYTSNSALAPLAGPLPSASLDGRKQTLAMNYTLVAKPFKNFELKGAYRHYDYNNDTPVRTFTPIQGDFGTPGVEENTPFGYNRKTFELTGNYYLGKKSSVKVGYLGEIMDRSHRDVEHSMENSFISAVDIELGKDLSLRIAYRHADRKPDTYLDDTAEELSGGITDEQVNHRRFDEAHRIRDRADGWIQYNVSDKATITAFASTVQDNYNLRGDTNSPASLQLINTAASPYYLYGVLKDLSYNFGGDFDYTFSPAASFFFEYSHERYHKRMASRYRVPFTAAPDGVLVPSNCTGNVTTPATAPCDSSNNDWGSVARDLVDIWTAGLDLYLGKRLYVTPYYSLSAGKGNVNSFPLGNPSLLTGPDRFILVGTNAAVNYPETTNRLHEAAFVVKFKLTKNVMPRFEYRFQQFDFRDYQTSAMTPYMGCVSPAGTAALVPGCPNRILTSSTSPTPVGTPSPFYPFFVVGDNSAPRYLFLGADQPSYRVHYIAATLEWHF